MDKINPLFTATATAVGGRNGHVVGAKTPTGGSNPSLSARLI